MSNTRDRFQLAPRGLRGHLCALFAAAFLLGCGGEEPSEPTCDGGCFLPPSPECVDGDRVTYAGPGECRAGACVFEPTITECAFGCDRGACVEPCDDVVCDAPPAPSCDGDVLVDYEPRGVCDEDTGVCGYTETRTDCADDDEICVQAGGARCELPPPTCTDGRHNQGETDVDCGGPCDACDAGADCREGADCLSRVCEDRVCQEPSCRDITRNGDETDVDCGGSCRDRCPTGQGCRDADDCISGVCAAGTCQAPSCEDDVWNGDEIDVDCGPPACRPCPVGLNCSDDEDCATNYCDRGSCAAPDCEDRERNANETDVDCGGSDCDPCLAGAICVRDADCQSANCEDFVCIAPTCTDGLLNQSEADLDCGGPYCAPCDGGSDCADDDDCASGICDAAICTAPSCEDDALAATESDVDCGGPDCDPCPVGGTCRNDSDCASGVCTGDVCAEPSCSDRVQNGDEIDVDCGGACVGLCEEGQRCESADDCVTMNCTEDEVCGPAPTCDDRERNGQETDVDCGGPTCRPCGIGGECADADDCATTYCDEGVCDVLPRCDDRLRNGDESDVDCGGSCDPCPADAACGAPTDCDSAVCEGDICQAPTCGDEVRNGSESDVDCGGSCDPCPTGGGCGTADDCEADAICDGGFCAESTCFDGRVGTGETGIDCGGECGLDDYCFEPCSSTWSPVAVAPLGGRSVPPTFLGPALGGLPNPPVGCSAASFTGPTPSQVFGFRAPEAGQYVIETSRVASPLVANAELVLMVTDAACGDSPTILGCDARTEVREAGVALALQAGEWVNIVLRGVDSGQAVNEFALVITDVSSVSCADGAQNGTEEGVDCGGACAAACPTCTIDTASLNALGTTLVGAWQTEVPAPETLTDAYAPSCGVAGELEYGLEFVAPAAGSYTAAVVAVDGGDVPVGTTLAVYGATCDAGDEIACVAASDGVLEVPLELATRQGVTLIADGFGDTRVAVRVLSTR